MQAKYWAIFILLAVAIGASVIYYEKQPVAYVGPVIVHHVPKPTPTLSTASSTAEDISGTSSPSSVEGWQTYTNSKYGFSFEYPLGWTYQVSQQNNFINLFPPGKSADPSLEYGGDASVSVYGNPKELDLESFEQSQNDNLFQESTAQTPLTINGYPAEKFFSVEGEVPTNVYLVNKGSIIVELDDVGETHADDGIADKMAQSIK